MITCLVVQQHFFLHQFVKEVVSDTEYLEYCATESAKHGSERDIKM